MSLDIRFQCNICGDIKEASKIRVSYNRQIHKKTIELGNGFVNSSIHICNDCANVIRETMPYEKS